MNAEELKAFVLEHVPSDVSIAGATVSERSGVARLTVTRSASNGPASVAFSTAPGSATAADFVGASGVISFAAGQGVATVSVSLRNDATDEPSEKFSVLLSNPQGLTIRQGVASVTIEDDDAPSVVSVASVPRIVARGMLRSGSRTLAAATEAVSTPR